MLVLGWSFRVRRKRLIKAKLIRREVLSAELLSSPPRKAARHAPTTFRIRLYSPGSKAKHQPKCLLSDDADMLHRHVIVKPAQPLVWSDIAFPSSLHVARCGRPPVPPVPPSIVSFYGTSSSFLISIIHYFLSLSVLLFYLFIYVYLLHSSILFFSSSIHFFYLIFVALLYSFL